MYVVYINNFILMSSRRFNQYTESCCSGRVEVAAVRRRRRPKVEVFEEVLRRLKEFPECEVSEEGFEDELWSHFNRLPLRFVFRFV